MKPGRNDSCICSSGKKYKKCCGREPLESSPVHPEHQTADAVANQARGTAGETDVAAAHNALGNLLRDQGRLDEAEAHYRKALQARPAFTDPHYNLGNLLLERGRLDDAVASYCMSIDIRPEFAAAHLNLGNAQQALGQMEEATASFRRAVQIEPAYVAAHFNLANALKMQNRGAEAAVSCRRALEIDPNLTLAIVLLAELHADSGRFVDAENLFRHAISLEAGMPEAWAGIARMRRMTEVDAGWLDAVQRIAEHHLPPRKEVYLRYAMGKYFDDVGNFEQAFFNYQRANELAKLYGRSYDRQQQTLTVDLLCRTFDRTRLGRERIKANSSARPVFVVGMPRSGTSLVEQILASHPGVYGAGELMFWKNASAMHETSIFRVDEDVLARLADDYLRLLQACSADVPRVIDKMPANFLFLGLIHEALPNARIIHIQRDPIDTCLSIYFQNFDAQHSYANDLGDLAHYYAQYLRLMAHWRSVFSTDSMLEVPYEALVDDLEWGSREMLAFIGLPWDKQCLDFHQCMRTVSTASNWQVRQKINKASVGRWRNYEKFVGPLLALIE